MKAIAQAATAQRANPKFSSLNAVAAADIKSTGANILPSAKDLTNARDGSFNAVYRHTILSRLIASFNQTGSKAGFTYIDLRAGAYKYDISTSFNRQWGINPVYDYGRAHAVARIKDPRMHIGHPFLTYMRRVREVNYTDEQATSIDLFNTSGRIASGLELPKLAPGFKYYPGNFAIIRPLMRDQDRAILVDANAENIANLKAHVGDDSRIRLYHGDVLNPESEGWDIAASVIRPLTAHALVHIDLGDHINVATLDSDVQGVVEKVLSHAVQRFPHATFYISYPIFGRAYQDQLLTACMKTGVRNILQSTFHIQQAAPFDNADRVFDWDAWGEGAIILKPPPNFEKDLNDVTEALHDAIDTFGPSVHTPLEKAAIENRQFPPAPIQLYARNLVDQSIDPDHGWKVRPEVSSMTPTEGDHISLVHAFKWEYFVPSYQIPRSRRFLLQARKLANLEKDMWKFNPGFRDVLDKKLITSDVKLSAAAKKLHHQQVEELNLRHPGTIPPALLGDPDFAPDQTFKNDMKLRPCKDMQLTGRCSAGDKCAFSHSPSVLYGNNALVAQVSRAKVQDISSNERQLGLAPQARTNSQVGEMFVHHQSDMEYQSIRAQNRFRVFSFLQEFHNKRGTPNQLFPDSKTEQANKASFQPHTLISHRKRISRERARNIALTLKQQQQ